MSFGGACAAKRADQTLDPYNYRLAVTQRPSLLAGSVEHPDRVEMFRGPPSESVLGLAEAALRHGDWHTYCRRPAAGFRMFWPRRCECQVGETK